MLAQNDYSIRIYRGASKTVQLTVKKIDGTAYDLSGATLILTVKKDLHDQLPLFQKSNKVGGIGVTIVSAKGGVVQFSFIPADTHKSDPRHYVYDVWVVDSSFNQYVLIPPSDFEVEPGVTIFL